MAKGKRIPDKVRGEIVKRKREKADITPEACALEMKKKHGEAVGASTVKRLWAEAGLVKVRAYRKGAVKAVKEPKEGKRMGKPAHVHPVAEDAPSADAGLEKQCAGLVEDARALAEAIREGRAGLWGLILEVRKNLVQCRVELMAERASAEDHEKE